MGVYNVILGETVSISYELFMVNCWLEVAIGEEGALELEILTPRQPIVRSLFAIYAKNADFLDGLDSTAFTESEHVHSFGDITGTVTDAQIPDDITIGYSASAGDSDTLDGMDSIDFAAAGHDHSFSEMTGIATGGQVYSEDEAELQWKRTYDPVYAPIPVDVSVVTHHSRGVAFVLSEPMSWWPSDSIYLQMKHNTSGDAVVRSVHIEMLTID